MIRLVDNSGARTRRLERSGYLIRSTRTISHYMLFLNHAFLSGNTHHLVGAPTRDSKSASVMCAGWRQDPDGLPLKHIFAIAIRAKQDRRSGPMRGADLGVYHDRGISALSSIIAHSPYIVLPPVYILLLPISMASPLLHSPPPVCRLSGSLLNNGPPIPRCPHPRACRATLRRREDLSSQCSGLVEYEQYQAV